MTNERQPQVSRMHVDHSTRNYAAIEQFFAQNAERINAAQPEAVAQQEPVVAQVVEPAVADVVAAWAPQPTEPAPAPAEPAPAVPTKSRFANFYNRAKDKVASPVEAARAKAALYGSVAVASIGGLVYADLVTSGERGGVSTANAQGLSTTPQTSTAETTTSTTSTTETSTTPSTTETTPTTSTTETTTGATEATPDEDESAPAPEQDEQVEPTAEQKAAAERLADRKANMAEAKNETKGVAGFVKTLETTKENYKRNIHHIFDGAFGKKKLDHSSTRSAMSSILQNFEAGKIGPRNGAEMLAMSAYSSPAFAAKLYNDLHNHKGTKLPEGVSQEEALASIERAMTLKDTKFVIARPDGTFMNYGQTTERGVFAAGLMQANGNHEMIVMEAPGYNKVYVKTSNGCFNLLNRVKVSVPESVQTSVTSIPRTPSTSNPGQPEDRFVSGPGGNPQDGIQKGPGQKPDKQKPGDKPTDKPGDKPKDNPKPKDDKNTTPGGVPGQNGGTPDKPGQGPAGQTPNEEGFVPGEDRPQTPAPKPTPAPLPNQPAPAVQPGEQTGQQPAPGAEPAPSTGTGQTIPGGNPDPQG